MSIVNVGHRGLFRYSRILQRADDVPMPAPVALIPDRDIPSDCAKALIGDRLTEGEWEQDALTSHMQGLAKYEGGNVRGFPSEQWTLEFDLARQPALAATVHQAVQIAKGKAGQTRDQIAQEAQTEVQDWQTDPQMSANNIAVRIFEPLHKKQVSKTEVAEQLSALITALEDGPEEFRARLPAYLAEAIEHVTAAKPGAEQ